MLLNNANALWTLLVSLVIFSCFFSITETAYMSANRYRLRHLARLGNKSANRVNKLLERPDRLLGVILLGDTFSDIAASAVATVLAIHYYGTFAVLPVTITLALIVLIFGEVAPKTVAALYPIPIALASSLPLWLLLKLLYPVVWLVNILSNGFLFSVGVKLKPHQIEHFSTDELRTIVRETGTKIPVNYQKMLLQLLDLEKSVVEDIMVPHTEIIGIDLNKEWSEIIEQLTTSQHTRLPVFVDHINNVQGILHVRDALNLLAQENLNEDTLKKIIKQPYFIPEGTSLSIQLLNFCQLKERIGLVVDEYGEIHGLVALEDILEEIVGEFTTDTSARAHKDILLQLDESYLVDGSVNIRDLNRTLHSDFPTAGPKTLSGLIIEYLEMIPTANIGLRIAGYPMEILQMKDNMVKTVKIMPKLRN